MPKNEGKLFEEDFKNSIPDSCWIYRLRDNAASFGESNKTRFASSNICDFILFNDDTRTMFLIECKSTKGTSVPLTMIRDKQKKGLSEASKHRVTAGLLINFRNKHNDTFFININDYIAMVDNICKKSFNIKDLTEHGAIRIECEKKRVRWKYSIEEFIKECTCREKV